MFTGIIYGTSKVQFIKDLDGLRTINLIFDQELSKGLKLGASVSINGVCLTVSNIKDNLFSFDIMRETLSLTTLGDLKENDKVNIERSAKVGQEIGGHQMSGHVDSKIEIVNLKTTENNHEITFKIPDQFLEFIFNKGYIGLHGASLTICNVSKENKSFSVHLIPETLRLTTFATLKVGDFVNLEIDRQTQAIVNTVKNYLENH